MSVLDATETSLAMSYGYGYDRAGNRVSEQVGQHAGQTSLTVTRAQFNTQNQMTTRHNSGAMPVRLAGSTDEPARSVTINGQLATVREGDRFVGWAELSPGSASVTVQATDYGDNPGRRWNGRSTWWAGWPRR